MTVSPTLDKVFHDALSIAIPDGALTVSKWAERYRIIPPESVANPSLAGRWQNERTPYLVEIMDAVNGPCNEIVFIASSQVGKTETGNNIIGFFMHIDPALILYCAETQPKAEAWGVEKFDPMVRATPELAATVHDPKSRDKGNTTGRKIFDGGMLNIIWATSAAQLSSRPGRIVILDEVEAYEATKEGSAVDLIERRMATAGDEKKFILISTPRLKDTSQMWVRWQNSTQEKYFVPCPHCGTFQVLNWRNEGNVGCVLWSEENGDDAYYRCVQGCVIQHEDKFEMLAKGEWRSTNPDYKGHRRGFWVNEIYSPFTTWADMALGWIEANQAWKLLKDSTKLQVFLNTRLAQWWEEMGETVDFGDLTGRPEIYEAEVPDGALVLAAGVDVQGDRLECEIIGYGRDNESWSIAYFIIYGDPALNDVWEALYDILDSEYETAESVMKVSAACIDTGGHHANQVYKFCKANAGRRWFAVKGSSTAGKPITSKPTRANKFNVKLFMVGTDTAKDLIFSYLRVDEPGPGYCHFPADPPNGEPYNARYFQMLCSEKKITTYPAGQPKQKYVKVNVKGNESLGARNEALDIRVYSLAALSILNPNMNAYAKRRNNLSVRVEKSAEVSQKNDKVIENRPDPHGISSFKGGGGWTSNY